MPEEPQLPSALPSLARDIRSKHDASFKMIYRGLDYAREVGELLTKAKGLAPHGG